MGKGQYPNWVKVIGKPVVRRFWAITSELTNIRRFNGVPIRVPKRVGMSFKPFKNIKYEVEEWESVRKFGSPGQTFLDVGANAGIISVAMSKVAGSTGNVISCEPNPLTYQQLIETLKLNRCSNVLPSQTLLTDQCGTAQFFISTVDELGFRSSIIATDPACKKIVIPAVTVDSLIQGNGDLDYMKIDAEGAEYKILVGAQRTLDNSRPIVQVEVHGQQMEQIGDSIESLFVFMKDHHYRCINIPTWSEIERSQFMACTHCHIFDPLVGRDLAYEGYGQVVFIPVERDDLFVKISPRNCAVCTL